jgi:hypothetical protein
MQRCITVAIFDVGIGAQFQQRENKTFLSAFGSSVQRRLFSGVQRIEIRAAFRQRERCRKSAVIDGHMHRRFLKLAAQIGIGALFQQLADFFDIIIENGILQERETVFIDLVGIALFKNLSQRIRKIHGSFPCMYDNG